MVKLTHMSLLAFRNGRRFRPSLCLLFALLPALGFAEALDGAAMLWCLLLSRK